MVTLNFRTFPKITVQDGLTPIPKAKLDVINLIIEKVAKGLVSVMTKSGEIMWVHSDIIKDEQCESNKPSSKASHAMLSPSQRMMTL